jgi:hypothetical protein
MLDELPEYRLLTNCATLAALLVQATLPADTNFLCDISNVKYARDREEKYILSRGRTVLYFVYDVQSEQVPWRTTPL